MCSSVTKYTVEPANNGHPGQKWPLCTGDRYIEWPL